MSQMFCARCAACQNVFDVIAVPVSVDVFVRVAKGAACPLCGNRKDNTCAPPRELTEAERTQRGEHRPILFSGPMVRAILREIESPGTGKTQTRRVSKRQDIVLRYGKPYVPVGVHSELPFSRPGWDVGDRLWVRETWWLVQVGGGRGGDILPFNAYEILYRADDHVNYFEFTGADEPYDDPFLPFASDTWRPSIFMPRWASRITLTVTDVRVQRLHDITEADAIAEGAARLVMDDDGKFYESDSGDHRTGFAGLWDHLNDKRGFGWDRNPWVVALTFRPELRNIDAPARAQRVEEPA